MLLLPWGHEDVSTLDFPPYGSRPLTSAHYEVCLHLTAILPTLLPSAPGVAKHEDALWPKSQEPEQAGADSKVPALKVQGAPSTECGFQVCSDSPAKVVLLKIGKL